MLLQLLLLFTVVPIIELALLIQVGRIIDVGPTIALVLLTGFVGAALARHEGIRTIMNMRRDLAEGRLPADRLIDALLILVAGVLLITPGLITDTIGLLLLIPPARTAVRNRLKKRFLTKVVIQNVREPRWSSRSDDFIDVEARPVDDGSNDDPK
jgi:UPF0716 protein FxsA